MTKIWSSAMLDCETSKTVCAKEWLKPYIKNLGKTSQQSILLEQNNHVYRFGDRSKIKTIQ